MFTRAATCLSIALAASSAATAAPTVLRVTPSTIDPGVKTFDDPNVVVIPDGADARTPVALFLTGTGGRSGGPLPFLQVVAGQGYRVIGLQYNDEPSVGQPCQVDPDPACSGDFRQMRIYGDGPSRRVANPPAESISARLAALFGYLDRQQPEQGWGGYVVGGKPDWSRIVVSGLSQGAGMAAYIAKQHSVPRVVLFSSPWDWTGRQQTPAPWLSWPSATPMDRWYAEYHAREKTVPRIQAAYAVLKIPAGHIRVFDREIPAQFAQMKQTSPNPYHTVTIRDPGYADDWRWMYGRVLR